MRPGRPEFRSVLAEAKLQALSGTIVVEFLDPIPPGLPKREFLPRLQEAIETASNRLLGEAHGKEPGATPRS